MLKLSAHEIRMSTNRRNSARDARLRVALFVTIHNPRRGHPSGLVQGPAGSIFTTTDATTRATAAINEASSHIHQRLESGPGCLRNVDSNPKAPRVTPAKK